LIGPQHPLLLGSGSPRRLEILNTLRIPTRATAARADESVRTGEQPEDYISRVTCEKLASVAADALAAPTGGVLVADTIVLVDGVILGKPRDPQGAVQMLTRLSGRDHEVWTRFGLASPDCPDQLMHQQTVRSRVVFRQLSAEQIAGYAATGEGLDKAGAYAVQGLGAFAVLRIEGSYGNVVGLPACELVSALLETKLLARFPL